MNSSENAIRSAPSRTACARAARALAALPSMSPTVGLSCATAIARVSVGRAFMGVDVAWRPGDGYADAAHPVNAARADSEARSAALGYVVAFRDLRMIGFARVLCSAFLATVLWAPPGLAEPSEAWSTCTNIPGTDWDKQI